MKKFLLVLSVMFMLAQLMGCASNVRPESQAPTVETPASTANPNEVAPAVAVEPVAPPIITPPVQPPVPAASRNATESLVNQARAQYKANNYQGAIAIAERALRIDRRAPDAYLILAQSYVQLANTQLALQFVQQGIRYAQAGTELAQTLLQVKDSLQK